VQQSRSVSIIIPARNSAHTIEACVASMLAQDWPKEQLEVLVIDNGSTDDTAGRASKAGARVIFEPQKGRSRARNRGAAEGNGEFLAFMDADSTAAPNWLQKCTKMLRYPWIGASQPLVQKAGRAHSKVTTRFVQAHYYLPFLATCGLVTTREAFASARGFDEELPRGVDVDFSFRLLASGHALAWEPTTTVVAAHDMGHGEVWHRGQVRGESASLLSKKWRSLEHTSDTQRWLDRIKDWARISLTDLRMPLTTRGLNATEATSKLLATIVADLKPRTVLESRYEPRTALSRVLGARRYLVLNADGAQIFDQAAKKIIDLTGDESSALECLVQCASKPGSALPDLLNASFGDALRAERALVGLRNKAELPLQDRTR